MTRPWRNPAIKAAMHQRVTATLCKGIRTRFGGRKRGLNLALLKQAISEGRRNAKDRQKFSTTEWSGGA
jgi:hypothetical protein